MKFSNDMQSVDIDILIFTFLITDMLEMILIMIFKEYFVKIVDLILLFWEMSKLKEKISNF